MIHTQVTVRMHQGNVVQPKKQKTIILHRKFKGLYENQKKI